MSALEAKITAEIARNGPMSVARYMALCLTDPEHGYYAKDQEGTGQPIGARGDFITAPEISQMFGELLGLWCAVTWQQMGAPGRVNLVELGPGRGSLMADCLRAARQVEGFIPSCAIHLVETGEGMRAAQRRALAGYDVRWHDDLAAIPDGPTLLLANEFFDALPVQQLIATELGWYERLIDDRGGLCFARGDQRHDVPTKFTHAAPGSILEISPARDAVAGQIGRRIAAFGGAALIIDYGHPRTDIGDTLQAVRRHARHGVLETPGDADLTTHVDFEALGHAAGAHGVDCHGPIAQGRFLRALGIDARAATLMKNSSPEGVVEIESARQRLTETSAMGMLFKAFAICPAGAPTPAGFEVRETGRERRTAWS